MQRTEKLARITITLPQRLADEVEGRISAGMYATPTEWIRNAIRSQLKREQSPMDRLIATDPRVAESLHEAETGQLASFDFDALMHRFKA